MKKNLVIKEVGSIRSEEDLKTALCLATTSARIEAEADNYTKAAMYCQLALTHIHTLSAIKALKGEPDEDT